MGQDLDLLLEHRPAGLYSPTGDFYIDPTSPVKTAVITHGHSDHARYGCGKYIASSRSTGILRERLGKEIDLEVFPYGRQFDLGKAKVSFHPAGHILGSSQVRIESSHGVALVTGDFKRESDPTCERFHPMQADLLVMESTFGLPCFRWPSVQETVTEINDWWRENQTNGLASVLYAYALGKAQRLLASVDASIGPIYVHGSIAKLNDVYRDNGVALPECCNVMQTPLDAARLPLVITVPSTQGTPWQRRFGKQSTAMASGWMAIRGNRRRKGFDRGFVVSDHADWDGLVQTVREVKPRQVWVTHGFTDVFARYLQEQGFEARPLRLDFSDVVEPSDGEAEE